MEFPPTNLVFHDRALFNVEMQSLLSQGWVFVGAWDQLPSAGSELEVRIADWIYRIGRGADDAVSGFRSVPGGPEEAVAVERIGLYVFACGAAEPTLSLSDFLGPQRQVLESLSEVARTHLFEVRMPIAANWKLVVSGAIEDYHLPHVHGRSVNPWRTEPAVPVLHPHGHSSYSTQAELGLGARMLHRALCGGAPVEPRFANHLIYPTLLTIQLWGIVHVTTFLPQRPDLTQRVTRIYEHSQPGALNPRRVLRAGMAAALERGMMITFREDQWICEEAQAGTQAGIALRRGPAHEEEARVEHFLAETGRRVSSTKITTSPQERLP